MLISAIRGELTLRQSGLPMKGMTPASWQRTSRIAAIEPSVPTIGLSRVAAARSPLQGQRWQVEALLLQHYCLQLMSTLRKKTLQVVRTPDQCNAALVTSIVAGPGLVVISAMAPFLTAVANGVVLGACGIIVIGAKMEKRADGGRTNAHHARLVRLTRATMMIAPLLQPQPDAGLGVKGGSRSVHVNCWANYLTVVAPPFHFKKVHLVFEGVRCIYLYRSMCGSCGFIGLRHRAQKRVIAKYNRFAFAQAW